MIAADFFCGFGGFSQGGEAAGLQIRAGANHDATAMAVFEANHPDAQPLLGDIWVANLRDAMAGDQLDVLLAAPDCRDFSVAKGGPIKSKRVRALPWSVVRAMKEMRPRIVFVENVPPFSGWGPCDKDGHRIPGREGETFRAWISAIRRAGYAVEWRVLDSALYGAQTRRKRFFAVARRDGRPIHWPLPTHGVPGLEPARGALPCIDFSIPCPSIFLSPAEARALGVRRPLAQKTMERLARGFVRFGPLSPDPVLVEVPWSGDERSDLCAAWAVKHYGGETGSHLRDPLSTITTRDHNGLALAYLTKVNHGRDLNRSSSLRDPISTITATQRGHALAAVHLLKFRHDSAGASLRDPLPTITSGGHGPGREAGAAHAMGLSAAYLLKLRGDCTGQGLREPLDTITAGGTHAALVCPFLMKYHGTGTGQSLRDPLRTVTTRDRFALVCVTIGGVDYIVLDIGLRMLTPRELLLAQFGRFAAGFDMSAAKTQAAQVRGIGGSVCPEVAEALIRANVGGVA